MNLNLLSILTSTLVVLAFRAVARASRRAGLPAAASPVLLTALAAGAVVAVLHVPLARFQELSAPLHALLGPGIVALGASVHRNRPLLRRAGRPLVVAVVAGTTAGVASALLLARSLGLDPLLTAATLTRTISTPFAILVQTRTGGPVALAAGLAVLTGVIGAILLPLLLKLLGLQGSATTGVAIGVAAHIVGTDAVGRDDPAAAGFAAVALVGTGVVVALVVPLLWPWLIG